MLWVFLVVHCVSCRELTVRDNDTSCTLATPDISFTNQDNYIDLPMNIQKEIGPGDKVQVGYTQILGVFKYIGCSPVSAIPANSSIHSTYPDPGQCYSLCRTKYFALNNKQCVCLRQRLTNFSRGCVRGCTFPDHTACGGEDINSIYLSVYEYVEPLNRTFDDGRFCYTYGVETNMYGWQYCGNKLTGLCHTGGLVIDSGQVANWKDYTVQCFAGKGTPSDGRNTRAQNSSFDAHFKWVGRVKTFFIESLHATEFLYPDQKGFMKWDYDSNRYILRFDSNVSLAGSKYLCFKENNSEDPTPENEHGQDEEDTVNIPILLGIIAAIIIITIIGLVCCKRKKWMLSLFLKRVDNENARKESKMDTRRTPILFETNES